MNFLSVCSGIEAASVAWHPLGWRAAGFSEIEPFPCAALAHHYPDVPNHGDMTKFKDWPDATLDLLVGGTPCQSFSVAGLRAGLADPRGNLALTYLGIADRYRPEWLIWENVPGVLSSDGGRAFGSILGGVAELGYGWAYRILDAQYVRVDGFGRAVPQRRRRVFVIGNSRGWRRSAAVLFEPESLSWDSAPRREAGKRVAGTVSARPTGGGGLGTDFDLDGGLIPSVSHPLLAKGNDSFDESLQTYVGREVSHCLNAGGMGRQDYETETVIAVAHALRAEGFDASEDGTGRGTPIVPIAFDTTQITSKANRSVPKPGDACHPLAAGAHPPAIAFDCKASGQNGFGVGEIASTLRSMSHSHSHTNGGGHQAVAYSITPSNSNRDYNARATDKAQALTSSGNRPSARGGDFVASSWAVRRLTPTECERLQGFPDGYTNIPWRRKNWTPDGPRYKALGNSMAVNVMRWLGTRIEMVRQLDQLNAA